MEIIITTDSTSDLPKEIINNKPIKVMPLIVNLGDEEYYDGVNLEIEEIFSFVENKNILPKTAARSPNEYKVFFEETIKENKCKYLIHISLSSSLSSSYENAKQASENFNNVYVVDSKSLSSGSGLLVMSAVDKIEEGKEIRTILDEIKNEVEKVQASFIINDLNYLHKGGRCSAIALFGANILRIKPKIKLTNGKMEVDKKYLGKNFNVLSNYVDDLLKENKNINKRRVFITYTSEDQEINDMIKSKLEKLEFDNIITNFAGSTISSHCGRNCLGVLFINQN